MLSSKLSGEPGVPCSRRLNSIPPERCPETSPHSTSAACTVCIAIGVSAGVCAPSRLRSLRGVVLLEDSAAGGDRVEDAVGDAPGLHVCQESINDFFPCPIWRHCMRLVVGDNFDVALAERHEQQDSMRLIGICDRMRVEFTMRELPGVSVLDALRHDGESERQPVEYQRHDD